MNELIKINNGEMNGKQVNTVNARELHEFLEVGKDFSTWIKNRIEQYDFIESQDFVTAEFAPQNGGAGNRGVRVEYFLTLDMAKELSMVERNEKGKQARKYFIDCENKYQQAKKVLIELPDNMGGMARLLSDYAAKYADEYDARLLAEAQIEKNAPLIEHVNKVLDSTNLFTTTQIAKALGTNAQKLNRFLHKEKVQFKQSTTWMLYAKYEKQTELFQMVEQVFTHSDGRNGTSQIMKWTEKGRKFIYELWNKKHAVAA